MLARLVTCCAVWGLVSAFVIAGRADDGEGDLRAFKAAHKCGDIPALLKLGPGVTGTYTNDAIVRAQYADALYAAGRFTEVVALTKDDPMIPALSTSFTKTEDLGFYWPNWTLWRKAIMAEVALGHLDKALSDMARVRTFEDKELLFLEYVCLQRKAKGVESDTFETQWFPQPCHGDPEQVLFAARIIPAMAPSNTVADSLNHATSEYECNLLRAAAGYACIERGEKETGLALMAAAMEAERWSTVGIPHALLGLAASPGAVTRPASIAFASKRWQEMARISEQYMEQIYLDPDYAGAYRTLENWVRLQPHDRDAELLVAVLLMCQEKWQPALDRIEHVLSVDSWPSENITCARIYYPVLLTILNRPTATRGDAALDRASKTDSCWKEVADAVRDPRHFPDAERLLRDKPNYYCVLLMAHGLLAETRGEYGTAEAIYVKMVSDDRFFRYMEFVLAQQRLHRVAPLAAIEELLDAPP